MTESKCLFFVFFFLVELVSLDGGHLDVPSGTKQVQTFKPSVTKEVFFICVKANERTISKEHLQPRE